MSLTQIWSPQFQSRVRLRGRALQAAERVKLVPAQEGELYRAEVAGRNRSYPVTIVGGGSNATVHCTCPVFSSGVYCKHVWAALLEIEQSGAEPSSSQEQESAVLVPKARRRGDGRGTAGREEPQWATRLSLLRPRPFGGETVTRAGAAVGIYRVGYVLIVESSVRYGGPVVELRQRQGGRGGWSNFKRLKVSADTLGQIVDVTDRELCAMLLGSMRLAAYEPEPMSHDDRMHSLFRLPTGAWRTLLKRMIETGRCYLSREWEGHGEPQPLSWDDTEVAWMPWLVGQLGEEHLELDLELRRNDRRMAVERPDLLLGGEDGIAVYEGRVGLFDDRGAYRWVAQMREDARAAGESQPIVVPRDDVSRFLDRLYLLPNLPEIELPAELGRVERSGEPVPYLEVLSPTGEAGPRNMLTARVWFAYQQHQVRPGQPGRYAGSEGQELIRRDEQREQRLLSGLVDLGLRPQLGGSPDAFTLSPKQMPEAVAQLLAEGWVITADQKLVRRPGPASLSVKSGVDWFELRGGVRFETAQGAQVISFPQILLAARSGRRTVTLNDGSEGMLPEQWLKEQGLLASIADVRADHLRFRSSQAVLLDSLLSGQAEVEFDQRFAQTRKRLQEFTGIKPVAAGAGFQGALRSYQEEGLGWLKFLRWLGVGGILADDMGLGKTVQVLAMLDARRAGELDEREEKERGEAAHRPSLIVVPRSVVFNWIDEASRFTPELRVQAYTGADRQSLREAFAEHDAIITSYGLMRRDIEQLQEFEFDYVILDEAQAIKNPQSQSAKGARLLRSRHRLALTGTPVENHLGDLWSIFEFLNPGMLGSNARFAKLIRSYGSPEVDDTEGAGAEGVEPMIRVGRRATPAAEQLAKALRPFILRRTKHQVLSELPEKTEQTLLCEMEPAQREVYDQLRQHYRQTLLRQIDGQAKLTDQSTMMVLEALLRLRQAACHPGLIDPQRADDPSAKLEALVEQLTELIEEGHKALVFSQFTSMLSLVRRWLDDQDIVYEYLDGQTRDRKQRVERFQNDPDCPLFLISLRAGGLGLNLTAASYVFILDPWWNPAVEAQAIDRAHRIGQTQHVFAYRLICKDTVEQRILELQQSKRRLAEAIVDGQDSLLRQLTREDLEKLLS